MKEISETKICETNTSGFGVGVLTLAVVEVALTVVEGAVLVVEVALAVVEVKRVVVEVADLQWRWRLHFYLDGPTFIDMRGSIDKVFHR